MLIGKNIIYFTELPSTSDYAKELVTSGKAKSGDAIVANRQTAGKGRMGRTWSSEADMGLYISVILEFRPGAAWATLLFGLAVCAAIEKTSGTAPSLKWPNDVIISNKKVCGIMTESCKSPDGTNFFVVGIGINVNNEEFPEELLDKAVSLFLETKSRYPISKIMKQLCHEIDYYYDKCKKENGFKPFLEEYKSRCITLSRDVTVTEGGNIITCKAVDISEIGGLVVRLSNGEERVILSGEASVCGLLGYV